MNRALPTERATATEPVVSALRDGIPSANKCHDCGRFISYADMAEGKAKHHFIPDSHFGPEECWWICKACNGPSTEQLVWDAEQSLRALQDRLVDPCDLWTLRRLLDNLETVQ